MRFRRSIFVGLLLGGVIATPAHAGSSTIVVDLDKGTVDPAAPAVNNWSEDTILIQIVDSKERDIYGELDVPVYPEVRRSYEAEPVLGKFFAVTFLRCKSERTCPSAKLNQRTASWTVYTPPRNFVFQVSEAVDNPAFDQSSSESDSNSRQILRQVRSFTISVEQKPFSLGWSAGFAGFAEVEDQRYRTVPIPGDETIATLERVSDKDLPYQLVAFAHYAPHQFRERWAFSVGLSTEVPVEDLSILLGLSVALRTLPVVNTGYLTAGLAYTKRDRLRPEYEGLDVVPATLAPDALVHDEYGLGAFVAVSFGFFGGEDQFRGVYPGSSGEK
jgi:hypothetical protein